MSTPSIPLSYRHWNDFSKLYPFTPWPRVMIHPQWLELHVSMSRTNLHSLKDVQVIAVRLYITLQTKAFYCLVGRTWLTVLFNTFISVDKYGYRAIQTVHIQMMTINAGCHSIHVFFATMNVAKFRNWLARFRNLGMKKLNDYLHVRDCACLESGGFRFHF